MCTDVKHDTFPQLRLWLWCGGHWRWRLSRLHCKGKYDMVLGGNNKVMSGKRGDLSLITLTRCSYLPGKCCHLIYKYMYMWDKEWTIIHEIIKKRWPAGAPVLQEWFFQLICDFLSTSTFPYTECCSSWIAFGIMPITVCKYAINQP